MRKEKTFAIVGGDLRGAHLANTLAGKESDYHVYGMYMEQDVKLSARVRHSNDCKLILPQSDIIVFPLPLLDAEGFVNTPLSEKRVRLEECLDYIPPDSIVLGGMVSPAAQETARRYGVEIIDYYQREEFAVLNAIATAEGAVEIALSETPITLFDSHCLIVGFGRISKVLAKLLTAFGAKVRVVARQYSDLAWAEIYGCEAVHIADLDDRLSDVDVLFNTVPAMIFDEDKLAKLGRNCLVIDLASKPGGVDFEIASALGLRAVWALSLPGKVAPISSGEITLSTIFNILRERGIL